MKLILAAAIALLASPAFAQTVPLDDLWMACDLAQIDASGEAPFPSRLEEIKLQPTPDGGYHLQLVASTSEGDALLCEIDYEVVAFRHNEDAIIGD